jgi:two-component system OmpR family sensor kinase
MPLVRSRPSLRQGLLGASVIAVLAGYGVMLLALAWLSDRDRREAHRQLGDQIAAVVQRGGSLAPEVAGGELRVWMEAGGRPPRPLVAPPPLEPEAAIAADRQLLLAVLRQPSQPRVAGPWTLRGHHYLSSTVPVNRAEAPATLLVLEDVSADLRRQRRTSLLLLVFAGISTLVTSALLRPVLNAGLKPLAALGERMETIEGESLEHHRLPMEPQPQELAGIAQAFNDLLDRLAASWERQRAFVNGVSHELRTPITLVGGYAARLRRRGAHLAPQEREQLLLIEEEAGRMGRLVSDLLDIARSDAGQLSLRRELFALPQACRQVVGRLAPMAEGRLQLAVGEEGGNGDGDPALVLGDRERFEQCLANLVENALKYSPPGSPVLIRWDRAGTQARVHVCDRGPGVPQADRERLLQRFQRGRQTGDIPGSGIGLAVVQTLMQAMGGAVTIGEAPRGGADFCLTLPMAPATTAGIMEAQPARPPAGPAAPF